MWKTVSLGLSALGFMILPWCGVLFAQAPAAPLVTALKSNSDVTLTWPPDPTAQGHRVYRTTDPTQPGQLVADIAAPPFVDQGAVPGQPVNPDLYYYYVISYNADGDSGISNWSFKINIPIYCPPGRLCNNFISLPYFYLPAGAGSPAKASDLCQENNDIGIVESQSDSCSTVPESWFCVGFGRNFDLLPGKGYLIVANRETVLDVVGSHDPDFRPAGTSTIDLEPCVDCPAPNLTSVPYHSTAGTAEGLCQEFQASGRSLYSVFERIVQEDIAYEHFCGAPVNDFDIVPGIGYCLVADEPTVWQPDVF